MADTAVRRGTNKPYRIQYSAATNGDDIGMAINAEIIERLLHLFDKVDIRFNLFTAWNNNRRRYQFNRIFLV